MRSLFAKHIVKAAVTGVIALVCILPASAQDGYVRFSSSEMTIREVFEQIRTQSSYVFAYNEATVDLSHKVRVPSGKVAIETALRDILGDQDLTWTLSGNQIVVVAQKNSKLTGKVVDTDNNPIPGATILNQKGEWTITAADGSFTTTAGPGSVLNISILGFKDLAYTVGKDTKPVLVLEPEVSMLEETVVVGYGTVRKKDITTSVAIVSTEDINNRPIVSAGSALQGKAAGVQVIQPSGMPGSGVSIRVRGATSVQASNEPLYVVDGIPTDDISHIAPEDIESLQVLKDASSSAIYGARAANGVVIITTRSGQAGKVSVSFNSHAGISRLGNNIEALDTEEYKELMAEMAEFTSTVPIIPEGEHRFTDWTKELFGTGINQNYQLSLSSGNDRLNYFVSAGHTRERGIVNKAYFNRTNFRANINSKLFDWLSFSMNASYSRNQGREVYESRSALRAGSILATVNTPPFMQVWDADNPKQYDENAYGSRILNPVAANAADMTNSSDRITGSLSLTFLPVAGLSFKTSFSTDIGIGRSDYYLDPISTSDGRSTNGAVSERHSRNAEWLMENILLWEPETDSKHHYSVMAGSTLQQARWSGSSLAGYDMSLSYPDLHSFSAANQINADGTWSSASGWALASFLGRVTYNYAYKYLFTANFRADGSSKFAKGHRWGFFPSVSAGWRISSEDFMEPAKDVVSDLKLRVGWGLNGNQGGIGNYSYMASMRTSKVAPTEATPYPGLAITPSSAANPELTWEKTAQYNVGIDLSLWEQRLVIAADAYYKKTDDLLLTITLPDNVNLPGGITRNDGSMVNKGVEFQISSENIKKGGFLWKTDFNISFNKNKLTKLGLCKVYYYGYTYTMGEPTVVLREGLPLGTFFGYISDGVDPETGDIIYRDISGNGSIGPEDRTIIGCAQPKFIYGMTNDLSYAGVSLSVFFQGSYGNDIFNASRIDTEGMFDFRNQSKAVLRRWKRPGMVTDIPRSGNTENIHNSTRFVEDGSYLRLSAVTLSWDLPKKWMSKFSGGLQLYATGQNLLTLTKYSGYDPEVNAYGGNAVAIGIDYGTYPHSRAFIAGLKLNF